MTEPSDRPVENLHWTPPGGNGPGGEYFGWLGPLGFSTLKVARVVTIMPAQDKPEFHVVGLDVSGLNCIAMPNVDAYRLMKRLGWKEPGDKFHA
jgi:hypothetical protein